MKISIKSPFFQYIYNCVFFFLLLLTKRRQISQALWLCLPVEDRDNRLLKGCLHLLSYRIHALEDALIFDLALNISFSFTKIPRGISLGVEKSNYESYILLSALYSSSLCYFQHLLCLWLLFKNLDRTHLGGTRGWRKWCSHLVTKVVFMLLLWELWFLIFRVAQSGSPGCFRISKDREKHLHVY